MKVVVLSPDFPPGRGGIQRLIGSLVATTTDEIAAVVSLKSGTPIDDDAVDESVIRVPLGPGVDQRLRVIAYNAVALVVALVLRPRALLVNHIVASPAARVWSRLTRRGYVLILHGQELAHRPGLMVSAVAGSSATVAVSRYTRAKAIELGADPERIHVVNPGVETAGIPAASARRRAQWRGRDRRGFRFVTVARLVDHYKGHDMMLEAIAQAVETVPGVHWDVVGDGPLRASLERKAVELEVDRHVTFHGSVSDSERDDLMFAADAFAMPSRVTAEGGGEGFGLVFLEAAACGLPVIAGAEGGALDAVIDGRTGLLVNPRSADEIARAIVDLDADRARTRELSLAAFSHAAANGWDVFAAGVSRLLKGESDTDSVPIRVIAVSHTSTYGGAERSLLTQLLSDRESGRVAPSLAAPEGELLDRARKAGLPVTTIGAFDAKFADSPTTLPSTALNAVRQARALARAARADDCLAVHANSPRAAMIAIAARAFGGPRVVTHVRDCLPADARGRLVRRLVSVGSTVVVANSEHTAADFRCGASAVSPQVVYNALDARFAAARPTVDELSSRSQNRLVMVGQITPWKRQHTAIQVLAELAEDHPELRLTIAGSVKFAAASHDNSAYRSQLDALAAELGVADRVEFTGEVEDVSALFSDATVVLMPSTEEPFGRVAIEAMACSAPVVATSVGGPREFIDHRRNGMLADPDELTEWTGAVAELLRDETLRAAIRRAARDDALRRFSTGASETSMSAIYRAAVER